MLVYTGTIRRYSQSAESIKLTLEDLTVKIPSQREKDVDEQEPEEEEGDDQPEGLEIECYQATVLEDWQVSK